MHVDVHVHAHVCMQVYLHGVLNQAGESSVLQGPWIMHRIDCLNSV